MILMPSAVIAMIGIFRTDKSLTVSTTVGVFPESDTTITTSSEFIEEIASCGDDMHESSASLHPFGEFLNCVALGITGPKTIDRSGLVYCLEDWGDVSIFDGRERFQNIVTAALHKVRILRNQLGKRSLHKVFQLGKP